MQKTYKIISLSSTADRLDVGPSTIYEWLNVTSRYYKPDLPKPVHLGRGTGFIEHEIDDFIRGLMQARGGEAMD